MPSLEQVRLLIEEIGPACESVNAVTELDPDVWVISCIDDQVHVLCELSDDHTRLTLHGELGTVPAENRLRTYEAMLLASGLANETGGVRLALDSADGEAIQECDLATADLDLRLLQAAIENFIMKMVGWQGVIGHGGLNAETPADPATDDTMLAGTLRV